MKKEKKDVKLRCPKCGSSFVYVRIKDDTIVCRSCGNISESNTKEVTNNGNK